MNLKFIKKDSYYVYKHYIFNDGKEHIFYIGKGIGDRIYSQSRNLKWMNIVNSNNGEYMVDIISYCQSEDEAYKLEKELQLKYSKIGMCDGCMDIFEETNEGVIDIFKLIEEDENMYNLIKQYILNIDTKNIIRKYKINSIGHLIKSIYAIGSYNFFTMIDMKDLTIITNKYIQGNINNVKKLNIKNMELLLNKLNICLIDEKIMDMNIISKSVINDNSINNIYDYFISNFRNNRKCL